MYKLLAGLFLTILYLSAFPALAAYQIQPGDVLTVEVLEDESLNRNVQVLPDGTINFPYSGAIRAAGRSAGQVQSALTSSLSPNFASTPTVFVTVQPLPDRYAPSAQQEAVIGVYAMGEIAKPGKMELTPGTTLLQALAQAGGFTKFAAVKRVELHRPDGRGSSQVYIYNQRGRGLPGMTVLQEGDVIVVPERRLFE